MENKETYRLSTTHIRSYLKKCRSGCRPYITNSYLQLWKALWNTHHLWKVERMEARPNYNTISEAPSPKKSGFGVIHTHNHSSLAVPAVSDSQVARVAVYESPYAPPRIITIAFSDPQTYIESITTTAHSCCRDLGANIPYTIIRELTENFIHAKFNEPVVSILDQGLTVRFSDQGCGIPNKEVVKQPGFSSATHSDKCVIRGVGSGLAMVVDYLAQVGGVITIEDNVSCGTVITISLLKPESPTLKSGVPLPFKAPDAPNNTTNVPFYRLSDRQKEVLAIVINNDPAGPSLIADYLGIALSTAYRDLETLQQHDLVSLIPGGKRTVTENGLAYIDAHMSF